MVPAAFVIASVCDKSESMKLRHAAALALASIGWYLMIPPLDNSQKPRTDLPLSQYWQDSSYDSARECEEAKLQLQRFHLDRSKKNVDHMHEFYYGMFESIAQGSCVASDDPRLKEK